MPNTVYGPYAPKTWTNGVDAANKTNMEHLETQAGIALNGHDGDLSLGPWVLSGMVATRNGGNLKQLDVTAGIAYLRMSDNTLGKVATIASITNQFLTSTPSTTYFLDLNPDGSWSFATSHSGASNHVTICSLTTDGSGNINVITDLRHAVGGPPYPIIVARAFRVSSTITGLHTILTITPAVNGLYRVSGYIRQNNGSNTNITAETDWSDPDGGATAQTFMWGPTNLNAYSVLAGANDIVLTPMTVNAASGGFISAKWNASAGTPNDTVSYIIERLT